MAEGPPAPGPTPPPPPPPPPVQKPPSKPAVEENEDPDDRPLLAPSNPRQLNEQDWRQVLNEEEFRVTRLKGTEAPYSGKYWNHRGEGTYVCSNCSAPLFRSESKYNAGCGWPSFHSGNAENLERLSDDSHGMERTEVVCKNCGSHQGHVFDDGPEQYGGERYCINSASLRFKPKTKDESA